MPILLRIQLMMLWAFFAARPHCCFMSSLLSTRTPRPFSAELLPHHSAPSQYSHKGFFPSVVQHLAFAFAEFHNVPDGPSLQSVWVALDNSPACGCIDRSPLFGLICKLEDQAVPCLLQMFNSTAPITDPWGMGLQGQYNPFTTLRAPPAGLVSFSSWGAPSVEPAPQL